MGSIVGISAQEFFRVHNAMETSREICTHFGITSRQLHVLRLRYGLPVKTKQTPRVSHNRRDDPTAEEIEQRAAECRAKRTAAEKARMARAGRVRWSLPAYSFSPRDHAFTAMSH